MIGGTFHGEAMESPATALFYSDGFGAAADYKYEDGTLYAKVYVASANTAKGTVVVRDGDTPLTPEEDGGYWVAYGTTLTLAATPESGYEFKGWVGDTRTITTGAATDATVAVTINKASQFEARFGLPVTTDEIFRAPASVGRFARRTEDFDVGDYVQDNLVLHFDGIRNAGADAPHSADATTWVNLGSLGSAQNAAKTALSSSIPSGSALGEWAVDGYTFKGKEYFALGGTVSLGSELTTQVSADYSESSQVVSYPAFFGATASSSMDDFLVYFNIKNNPGGYPFFKLNNATTHAMGRKISTPYLTAIYDAPNSRVSIEDAVQPNWQSAKTTAALGNWPYAIGSGRATDAQLGVRMYFGKIRTVRVYAQVLTNEQLEWNRLVDDARFFGGGVDVDLVIAPNGRGLEGVEPAGSYTVNGSHTFSATNLTDGIFTWAPAGYTLEKWDASNDKWVFFKDVQETSFAYTNCTANGKMRLTWLWIQTGSVKGGYDVGDYAQDGLLLHFDGIRNAGASAAHSADATTWVNLGSLGSSQNATKTALTEGNVPSGALAGMWSDNGYTFKGLEYFALGGTVALGGAVTAQVVTDYDNSKQIVSYPAFLGAISDNNDQFFLYFNRYSGSTVDMNTLRFKLKNATMHAASTTYSGCGFINAIYDTANGKVSVDEGVLPDWQKSNASGDLPAWSYAIGTARQPEDQKKIRMLVGTVKSVRVYGKVLPDWQLQHNRQVDQVRFNGNVTVVNGAVGETGAVGASSVADGVYDISSGTWTITAPEVVADGHRYLAKLLVETYNASTGEWEATTAMPQWANSYTVDKTAIGDNRIRLTWTWEIRKGSIIAVF